MNKFNTELLKILYIDPVLFGDNDMYTKLMEQVWYKMKEQNLVKIVLWSGEINDFSDFCGYICKRGVIPVVLLYDGSVAAFSWLNCFEGRTARGHYCCFKEFWGKGFPIKLGNAVFKYFLNLKDSAGFFFDTLIGISPSSYALSRRTSVKSGGVHVGTIPNFCSMHDGTVEDGDIITVTRQSLEEA